MTAKSATRQIAAGLGLLLLSAAPVFAAEKEPAMEGSAPIVRRLSPEQYRQSIADIFGDTIQIGGRFEPEVRFDGLLAVGATHVSVTNTGFEQYDQIARSIAQQVIDEPQRSSLIPCKPASAKQPDDACAQAFLGQVGRLLFRRPLSGDELQSRVKVARDATLKTNDFYQGLSISLSTLLQSSQFLFVRQELEPDPSHRGQFRLTGYSKASQLSLFFWNASPDDELLMSAETGALHTNKGLTAQIDRLVRSPRLEAGMRAFFSDMLNYDKFEALDKDHTLYPKFTSDVLRDSAEQTLRTITDVLREGGDYRDIFTTRKTALTESLAAIYGVPFISRSRNGAPAHWMDKEYAAGDPRAGVLSQISFVALHSHPGRSSPTLRGKALREIFLCQKVPDPPGNVDFTVVQDTSNAQYKTARERLEAHRTTPACAGCHKIMDPMGLALENFDADGSYRTSENKVSIDASGVLDGIAFSDAVGLGNAVHDNPAAPSCLVKRLYGYSTGRSAGPAAAGYLKYLDGTFAAGGYNVPALMRQVALSKAFFNIQPVQTAAAETGK